MPKARRPAAARRELRCVSPQPVFGAYVRADTGERVCGGVPGCHPDPTHAPVLEWNTFAPVPLLPDAEAHRLLLGERGP